MASGKPFDIKELRYIWDTRGQWAALVARDLSLNYSHLNGGSRTRDMIHAYQNEMEGFKSFGDWLAEHTRKKEESKPSAPVPDLRKGAPRKRKSKNAAQS